MRERCYSCHVIHLKLMLMSTCSFPSALRNTPQILPAVISGVLLNLERLSAKKNNSVPGYPLSESSIVSFLRACMSDDTTSSYASIDLLLVLYVFIISSEYVLSL